MKTINITKPITVTLADGEKLSVAAGIQKVDDDVANHWYVQAHTEDLPDAVSAKPGRGRRKADDDSPGGDDAPDEATQEQQQG